MANKNCPLCGSPNIRCSYYTETAAFAGKAVAKLSVGLFSLPFGPNINRVVTMAAGNLGATIGKSMWNKMVCTDCHHTWESEESVFQ